MLAAISANATFACPPEAADSNTLVLGALSCVRDMIGACRERIRSREATLADLSLGAKAIHHAFLERVNALSGIPSSHRACVQAVVLAFAEGLATGVLAASAELCTTVAEVGSSTRRKPSRRLTEAVCRGIDAAREGWKLRRRAALGVATSAASFPMMAAVLPSRAWRDALASAFAVGYALAGAEAVLVLVYGETSSQIVD